MPFPVLRTCAGPYFLTLFLLLRACAGPYSPMRTHAAACLQRSLLIDIFLSLSHNCLLYVDKALAEPLLLAGRPGAISTEREVAVATSTVLFIR